MISGDMKEYVDTHYSSKPQHDLQRTWIGLTNEQIDFLMPYCNNEFDLAEFREFARAIEAKLKEKNT